MRKDNVLSKLKGLEGTEARHGFLVYGESMLSTEKLAMDICQWLEKERKLPFQGSVRHFSIHLPYFADAGGARKFLDRLQASVSIARDCYEEYCGIILLECAEEWGRRGVNEAMRPVMDYLRSLSKVRYILLLPGTADRAKAEALLPAFSIAGVWVLAEAAGLDENRFLSAVLAAARRHGFKVDEEVQEALRERVPELGSTDVESVAEEWMLQLSMNREMRGDKGRRISCSDLSCLAGIHVEPKQSLGFGFVQNR